MHPSTMVPRDRSSLGQEYAAPVVEHRFSPYVDNHGSVVAISGPDYAVIASDTRLSGHGYSILSREQSKLFGLGPKTVLGSTGCWCDVLAFTKFTEARYVTEENTLHYTAARRCRKDI
jgi:20S proteasome subunit beta 6